jgi:hypothetical protein
VADVAHRRDATPPRSYSCWAPGEFKAEHGGQGFLDLLECLEVNHSETSQEAAAGNGGTARQIAALSASMPVADGTGGRSIEGERELDSGTTATRSFSLPVNSSSTERTTAGRSFPGSPLRAAPKETSQISPRRGSVDAICQHRLPLSFLCRDIAVAGVGSAGLALGAQDLSPLDAARKLRQQG